MKAVLQRVSEAKVIVETRVTGEIMAGLLILLGVGPGDTQEDIEWLVRKISAMRIFADDEGKMNKSIVELELDCLVVSQFTLHASTKKGNRPSFINAAPPDMAERLYRQFVGELNDSIPGRVQTGEFGAYMDVHLVNDGPVTILMDTENKE